MDKTCTLCKIPKPVEEFHQNFRKGRKKIMVSSRCKICANEVSKNRMRELYKNDKGKLLERANKCKRKAREAVSLSYARGLLICTHEFDRNALIENPELVQAYATQLKIKRTLKKLNNGKK